MSFEHAAEVYDRHVGRYSAALATALADAAEIRPPLRALDVGCGPGGLAGELAQRLGPGSVAAVDPSARFAAAARERLAGVDVRCASAEELPFADDSFDAVLSQLVVNFLPDPRAGLAEMQRVTRSGGVVAGCVWDYAGEMTMLRAFWDAALELDPEAPDEGRVMQGCSEERLRGLWEDAGLHNVATGGLVVHARYESFEDLWSPLTSGLGPSGAYCASRDEETRGRLADACFRQLGSPEGPFGLTARAWFVRGIVAS